MTKYFQEIQAELKRERNPFAYYPEGAPTELFPAVQARREEEGNNRKKATNSILHYLAGAGVAIYEAIRSGLESFF